MPPPVRQVDASREDILVMAHAVGWERVDATRIGPDRMRLGALVDRDAAVVAVEAGLDAVRRREHRRDAGELVWRLASGSARQDVVGIPRAHAGLALGRG